MVRPAAVAKVVVAVEAAAVAGAVVVAAAGADAAASFPVMQTGRRAASVYA